ncbi:hypothetical protein FRB90_007053, partial [Tulasnella sp. 427]
FLVFGSEDPQALSICPDDESVAAALVSASIYHSDQTWTCAPPQSHEKAFAASKITGEDLPYVGAEWVFGLGRQSQWTTLRHEQLRTNESNGIVTTPAHPSSLSTSGPTSTSLTTPLDENEGTLPGSIPSITDKSDPENQSGNSKRTRDQIDSAEVASPDNDPEEVAGPVKKARVDDHITTEDRKLFVQHMVKAHQDSDVNSPRAIKDFIRVASRRVVLARLIVYADSRRTYPQFGSNRAWTSSQWAEYLKQNKKQIQSEVATLTRTKAESTQV